MTLKERVQGPVTFSYFREGELWYKTADGFEFPIPVADTGTGVFRSEDKGMMFMRWIRKHMELLEKAQEDQKIKDNYQHGTATVL